MPPLSEAVRLKVPAPAPETESTQRKYVPPRASSAVARAASRRCRATSREAMRALPKITTVLSMRWCCCTSSGFNSSSCMRTGRNSLRSRKSLSVKASR